MGASDKSDRAVVNGAASVSAVPASVPSAAGFDLSFEPTPEPEQDLSLEWILLAVTRQGEAVVLDADSGFFEVDLLPEFWACDNGIDYPEGLAAGLYLMTEVAIRQDSYGDPQFKGNIKPMCVGAQAIETGTAKTEGLGPKDGSAVLQGCAHTQEPST